MLISMLSDVDFIFQQFYTTSLKFEVKQHMGQCNIFLKNLVNSWNCHDKKIDFKYANVQRKMWPKILWQCQTANMWHQTIGLKCVLMCIESQLYCVHSRPIFPPNCLFDNAFADIYNQLNH